MRPRRLLLLLLLVFFAAACSFPGRSTEARVQSCEDDLVGEAYELAGRDASFSKEKAHATIHATCVQLIAEGIHDADDEERLESFMRAHPDLAANVCALTAPAAYKRLSPSERKYITRAEVERLARDGCRYAAAEGYGAFGRDLDLAGLYKAHPELGEPFCTAGTMYVYDTTYTRAQKATLPRSGFQKLARRVCLEAIRTGIMSFASGDFRNPTVDQARLNRLLARTMADMRSRGELPPAG